MIVYERIIYENKLYNAISIELKTFPRNSSICLFMCILSVRGERHEMSGKNIKLECSHRSILICNVTETKENNFKMGAAK